MYSIDCVMRAFCSIASALSTHVYRVTSEADLQRQVQDVLTVALGTRPLSEVPTLAGRYDLLVNHQGIKVVLELKLKSAPAPVERQAQRYAKMPDVDGVMVVTTSVRLAAGLRGSQALGGKPFMAVSVRTT